MPNADASSAASDDECTARPCKITTAMILAAGFGTRMRPLTDVVPKPLVELAGRPMIGHVLARLDAAGMTRAIVNVHYKADQIESHLANWRHPEIIISDERDALLDTGGGVVRALPKIGTEPFLIHNSDSVWIEQGQPVLADLLAAWRPDDMDVLMLLADPMRTIGYHGPGDFSRDADGRILRRGERPTADYVFAGVSIMHPSLFANMPTHEAFSLNRVWDIAIARQRAFSVVLDGLWMHVGTPEALVQAEEAITQLTNGGSGARGGPC